MHKRLLFLVIGALLPLVLLAAGVAVVALRWQQERMREDAVGRANAVAERIDHELTTQIELLKVLARSPTLDGPRPDLAAFHEVASRFKAELPNWDRVFLADLSGRQAVNTGVPFGTPLAPVVDEEGHRRTLIERRPIVGNLAGPGPRSPGGQGMASIRVPVIRDGAVTHTLAATIRPGRFGDILRDGIAGSLRGFVVDGAGTIVAATATPEQIGTPAGPMALKARAEGDSGVYDGRTPYGAPTVTAFRRSAATNWSVHVAIPLDVYRAPFERSVWILSAAGLAALGLSGALVWLLRREILAERREARAREQASRMEALGRMTGGVAHDVNNLLMAVQGNAEMAARRLGAHHKIEDPRLDRYLASIQMAVEKGTRITRDLLVFSRGGNGGQAESFDVAERVSGNLGLIRQSLRGDIAVDLDLAPGLFVTVDPVQLDLALLNLVVNARDAMPNGGSLRIALRRSALPGRPGGHGRVGQGDVGPGVLLSVTDTGVGVPADALAHVFEPFFTTKGIGAGTGLGLSQVYGFAKAAGGGAAITSTRGQGTTVSIHLPEAASPRTPSAATKEEDGGRAVRPGTRVLLVEDNEDIRKVTADFLTEAGFAVRQAADAGAALDMLAGAEVDAVVSDIRMPGAMDGVALARRIRAERPRVAVLLVSGYSETAAEARALGFTVIGKPYEMSHLVDALARETAASGHTAVP